MTFRGEHRTDGAGLPAACHLLGVGGSGMLPLALLLRAAGVTVSGADRAFDRDPTDARRAALAAAGVALVPQTSAPPAGATVVVSTAIEPDHPALQAGCPVMHRSEALVRLLASRPGKPRLLVAGSSGKTTTTAMLAWIMQKSGRAPLVYVGGEVDGLAPHGARPGAGPAVVEVDESDGSISRFTADVAVVTSVSADHKPLEEIRTLFREFRGRAGQTVLSRQAARELGEANGVEGGPALSGLLGDFNRINEAVAVAAAECAGVEPVAARAALADFPGIHRRLEIVAQQGGRMVIDDFAHNPEKIDASLGALLTLERPLLVIFQPHGFQPTRMHHRAWGEVFRRRLASPSRLICLPIFDAGGTVKRDIDSGAVVAAAGENRAAAMDRAAARAAAREFLKRDRAAVVVMGARDPSLAAFAREIAVGCQLLAGS